MSDDYLSEERGGTGADWTEATARRSAHQLLAAVGINEPELHLLRFGNNAVFRVDRRYVIRVARPTTPPETTRREAEVATALAAGDVPVVRLAPLPSEQPLEANGIRATVWDYLPSDGLPSYQQFGRLVRQFHDRTAALELPVPNWQPLATARQRLDVLAEQYSPDDMLLLEEWYRRIDAELNQLQPVLPAGVIHGQAERGNALVHDGQAVFLDFERVCRGPREWDLIDTAVSTLRFNQPRDNYQQFADAYGYDVLEWEGFPVLRRVWELRATTWLMQAATHSSERAAEAQVRIDTWRNDEPMKVWRGF